jgi:O-antigen ligase
MKKEFIMKPIKKTVHSRPQYFNYISILFFTLFFTFAAFNKALFNGGVITFEKPIYYSIFFTGICLLIFAIRSFTNSKKQTLEEYLPNILIWLIPLTMVISLVSAASYYMAINGVFISLLYSAFFTLSRTHTSTEKGKLTLASIIFGTGYIIVIFGFMNWFADASLFGLFNWSPTPDGVSRVYQDAVQIDSNGPRMASVFQYANTYAGYLSGLLIVTLYLIASTRTLWIRILSSSMIVPIMLSLLLTLSRGGWALAVLSFFLLLFIIHIHRQLLMVLYAVIGALITFASYGFIDRIGDELRSELHWSKYLLAWVVLLGASAVVVLLSWIVHRYVVPTLDQRFKLEDSKRRFTLIIPAILLILGSLLIYTLTLDSPIKRALPDEIEQRFNNINLNQHSVLERGTFYRDGWKIFKDYPIIGAGSGAWKTLYEKYQNNPYISTQAHNFFMQHLVETGLVGIIVLSLFFVVIFGRYLKFRFTQWANNEANDPSLLFFLFIIPILLHSLIDFDMSYVYIGALVFTCMGALSHDNSSSSWITKLNIPWSKIRLSVPVLLTIIALLMIIVPFQYIKANDAFNKGMERLTTARTMNDYMVPLTSAVDARPYHPSYVITFSDVLTQLHAQTGDNSYAELNESILTEALAGEPYNRIFLQKQIDLLLSKGYISDAYDFSLYALEQFPWDIQFYEFTLELAFQQIELNNSEKQDFMNQALSVYKEFNKRVEHLKTLPEVQAQGREFAVTSSLQLLFDKLDLYIN